MHNVLKPIAIQNYSKAATFHSVYIGECKLRFFQLSKKLDCFLS